MLQNKNIDVDTFLNGIVSPNNAIFRDEHLDFIEIYVDESDGEMETDESHSLRPVQNSDAISGSNCVICLEEPSDILLSCGHYKYCLRCFEIEKEIHEQKLLEYNLGNRDNEPTFKCPLCQQKIQAHMHIKKIFVN